MKKFKIMQENSLVEEKAEKEDDVDRYISEAAKLRGHLCLGLPLGVKMGRLGLRLLHMEDETSRDNLMVVVENNKCPVDGIQVTTGCTAGSRRLKILDHGKSAAVFYDGNSGVGFRVTTRPDFLYQALRLAIKDGIVKEGERVEEFSQVERRIMMNAFTKMSEDELLESHRVRVCGKAPLLPKIATPRVNCSRCGEEIMDGKGFKKNDAIVCDSCLYGSYFVSLDP